MPKRTDIQKIMIIGSGPIVIGQACEFDYSGSQAAKALKEEGYEVILVNSNPATIMEHIEQAGIHSGDSACVLPPHNLSKELVREIERQTVALAEELGVIGLMNIQFAVKDGDVYILEVNPRASRTAPFVSKATGVPLAKLATNVIM